MQIKIHSFLGVKSAEFTLDKITLIAGDNEAGKSSINKAVASALTGMVIPVPGVTKTLAGMLVHRGVAKGGITITTPEGEANIEWPRASLKTTGEPPTASEYATGLTQIAELPPKERATALVTLLQATPTQDDLSRAIKPHGVPDEAINNIWQMIEKNNWDAAHSHAKETGAKLKGQWEFVTKQRYGSKVAQSYTPEEWEPDLEGASEELLSATVTDARDALDGMIAINAVDESKQELASKVPELERRTKDLELVLDAETASLDEFKRAHAQLVNPNVTQVTTPCPHCNGSLTIVGSKVEKPREYTAQDKTAWQESYTKVATQQEFVNQIRINLTTAQHELSPALKAQAELQSTKEGNSTADQVEQARNALKDAERRLNVWQTKTKADRLNNSIQQNIAIVQALDMTGVRQTKLASCLYEFLEQVNLITTSAGWGAINIDSDMAITYNDTPYILLSKSAQWRVNVALQVAIAVRDGSKAVLIDGADILGKAGRNGLFKMLRAVKIPVLVNMTMPDLESTPKLPQELGSTNFIYQGVLSDKKN